MGRRKSDKTAHRLLVALACLSCAISLLAAVLGYRALKISTLAIETLDTYNDVLRRVIDGSRRSTPILGS